MKTSTKNAFFFGMVLLNSAAPMKKCYTTEKFKKHQKRRAKSELKRRTRKKTKQRAQFKRIQRAIELGKLSTNRKFINRDKKLKNKVIELVPPNNFNMTDNPEDTLAFFDRLDGVVSGYSPVKLEMSNVHNLGPEVLLYLLSRLNIYDTKYGKFHIRGTIPLDPESNRLIAQSGFYNFVRSRSVPAQYDTQFLQIKRGVQVAPDVAKEARIFSDQVMNVSGVRGAVYPTLIECMANTNNHAYHIKNKMSEWWMIAIYNKLTNGVKFVFLDNGLSIPVTMKKRISEKVYSTEHSIIEAALKGENRSRTKKQWRGKGLPRIYSFYQKGHIKNLNIISGNGYLNFQNGKKMDLKNQFYGTLLTWEYV